MQNYLPEDQTQIAAKVFNELLRLDPECIKKIIKFGASCSDELANHPLIILRKELKQTEEKNEISVLSLINSILGEMGQRKLALLLDENDDVIGFKPYRGP